MLEYLCIIVPLSGLVAAYLVPCRLLAFPDAICAALFQTLPQLGG